MTTPSSVSTSERKPTNCQQEPPYPEHETVVASIRYPMMTAHLPTAECSIQEPHQTADCGLFAASPTDPQEAATQCNCAELWNAPAVIMGPASRESFNRTGHLPDCRFVAAPPPSEQALRETPAIDLIGMLEYFHECDEGASGYADIHARIVAAFASLESRIAELQKERNSYQELADHYVRIASIEECQVAVDAWRANDF